MIKVILSIYPKDLRKTTKDLMVTGLIIQFNSIPYYVCAESTAIRPITDTALCTSDDDDDDNNN
jgi:hypothetical protein